eukprot:CAMPEP_0177153664 /NCGR_PEP_ID=MMETSP0367-20130122/1202_1 /TAXON_ID=447022 ORGANISM="Scrippsiella hangoei-like, Strain SHHI-4" /NCGR_SAMPLE_ID=MMETSP0367 /ASSEMBLY_ACC=CAM_ASM_000362 /LENGTH=186 /DNA_ID=CAMNT_0018598843 /DNA_START=133 /DNA_END=690 /DNA_ORIENTATION=-
MHRVPRKVVIGSWGATLSRTRRRQLHHSHNRFMLRVLNQRSWKGLLQISSGTALMHHFVCKAMIRLRQSTGGNSWSGYCCVKLPEHSTWMSVQSGLELGATTIGPAHRLPQPPSSRGAKARNRGPGAEAMEKARAEVSPVALARCRYRRESSVSTCKFTGNNRCKSTRAPLGGNATPYIPKSAVGK